MWKGNWGIDKDPIKCSEDSIRRIYGDDTLEKSIEEERCVRNLIHMSDSNSAAKREINLWFGEKYVKGPYGKAVRNVAEITRLDGEGIIKEIMDFSNQQQAIVHGIKLAKDAKKIMGSSLKPHTPESGPCSFWASGRCILYPVRSSLIFNYSGVYCPEANTQEYNLALTSFPALRDHFLNLPLFEEDSHIKIGAEIPYSVFALLNVKVKSLIGASPREIRMVAERTMILGLHNLLSTEIPFGKLIRYGGLILKNDYSY
ncbi:hypothetical protein GW923_00675 [Candidatus Pacearchaeota archaeon]|nr:hypothetical protein [Candidatus Pacearchaeota archaeon]